MTWNDLDQDRDKLGVPVNTVLNLQVV